jgi:hypothetical protein
MMELLAIIWQSYHQSSWSLSWGSSIMWNVFALDCNDDCCHS